MKLAPLFAQYLYKYKRLDLPGLGTFLLDQSFVIEDEKSVPNKLINLEGVNFQNDTSIKEVPELIGFITLQTGKIKVLATADLESYLELAQQFLNIGNPFIIEGIGSLEKIRSGECIFRAIKVISETGKDTGAKGNEGNQSVEEPLSGFKSIFLPPIKKINWKKPIAILLLLVGLTFAIWGGYIVYKRATTKNNKILNKEKIEITTPQKQNSTIKTATRNFKFVIETSAKERALNRFQRLKGFGLDVQMETKDSISFKLFFLLPASVADTARMRDSLYGIYTPQGNKAYIEN